MDGFLDSSLPLRYFVRMPTPDEVDAAGESYGPMDVHERLTYVARWQSNTYEGKSILPGRWYHVMSADGITSWGLIDASRGSFYAFPPVSVGVGLGDSFRTLDEAIRALVPTS